MAVPKKKTSQAKRKQRSASKNLKPLNIVFDRDSGEPKLPHRMSLADGRYNGKIYIKTKEVEESKTAENSQ